MKCGDKGHVTAAGAPCQQTIGADAPGCLHHDPRTTPEQKRILYLKGGIASRMKTALAASYVVPEFDTPERIVTFARELARVALKEDVDLRRVAEARGAAALALSAHQARSQQALVDALLKLEHGGAAVALLAQFTAGQGQRRPLPGTRTA